MDCPAAHDEALTEQPLAFRLDREASENNIEVGANASHPAG